MIEMSTDESGYKYGASVMLGADIVILGDYWEESESRPIHEKEADAVLKSLQSLGSVLLDSRVDVWTDNMAVVGVWENQGGRSEPKNSIMKGIFGFVSQYNVDMHKSYVPAKMNEADGPSRVINAGDTMLSDSSLLLVESSYGPHSADLMALDSNVMKPNDGSPLSHFTPWLTPCSAGVNVFSQNLKIYFQSLCFPPVCIDIPYLMLSRGTAC